MKDSRVLIHMAALYCRHEKHEAPDNLALCAECRALVAYAMARKRRCGRDNSCRRCPVHCYSPDRRAQIRAVMRYSGPRMLLVAPLIALRHLR